MSSPHKQITELRKNKKALAFMMVIIGAALLLVLWALVSFGASLQQKRDLIHHGMHTTAVVTKHTSQFEAIRGGGYDIYSVSYTFNPQNTAGQAQTITRNNVELYHADWQKLAVGLKLDVTYLPNKVSQNEPTVALKKVNPGANLLISWIVSFALAFALLALLNRYKSTKQKGFLPLLVFIGVIAISFFAGYRLGNGLSGLIASIFLR